MKKSRRRLLYHLFFWLFILVGTLWVAYAPKPTHHVPGIAHVTVEQMLEEIPTQMGEEKGKEAVPMPPLPATPRHVAHPPEIAIVIDDVGLDMRGSKRAIELPASVTLSFMPYASRLKEQTRDAREAGHELMLHMPMEPVGRENPGPGALTVDLSNDEIREKLDAGLASFTGFDGMNNHMGSKFTAYADGMQVVAEELKQRDLFYLDSRTSAKSVGERIARENGVPTISRDIFLDDVIEPGAIIEQLRQAEKVARKKGYAVAIGHPHGSTMDVLEKWIPEAEARGVTFVPVKELIQN